MSGAAEDYDLLAAEYVLGVLGVAEARAVERLATGDQSVVISIAAWRNRLAPLALIAQPVQPPDTLWPRIATAIGGFAETEAAPPEAEAPPEPIVAPPATPPEAEAPPEPIVAPPEAEAPPEPIVAPPATPPEAEAPPEPIVAPPATPPEAEAPPEPIVVPPATPPEAEAPPEPIVAPPATPPEAEAPPEPIVAPPATPLQAEAPPEPIVAANVAPPVAAGPVTPPESDAPRQPVVAPPAAPPAALAPPEPIFAPPPVAPPVWLSPAVEDPRLSGITPVPGPGAEVVTGRFRRTWNSPAVWRTATAAALALAAVFAGIAFVHPPVRTPQFAAALAPANAPAPVFLAETMADGMIMVRPLSRVTVEPGKDLELWALRDGATRPISLGVLPAYGRNVKPLQPVEAPAKLLVSLEPQGGSPTGQPTGPVVYAGDLERVH